MGHGEYHDESKKDVELEMLTMLSVNQDNGEWILCVPFIDRRIGSGTLNWCINMLVETYNVNDPTAKRNEIFSEMMTIKIQCSQVVYPWHLTLFLSKSCDYCVRANIHNISNKHKVDVV